LYQYTVPGGLSVAVIFPRILSVSVLRLLVTSGQRWPTLTVVGGVGGLRRSVNPLFGRSVLIVEDEPLIALELHEALHGAGASILAATTIKEALVLIAGAQICAAIVDVNLGGHDCSSVCAALSSDRSRLCSTRDILVPLRYRLGLMHQRATSPRQIEYWSIRSRGSSPLNSLSNRQRP
jgi:hypothetical protein